MSTNYTEHYNLCQWEAGDKVLRTDFNDDNAKLDAALARVETTANAAKAIADTAFTRGLPPVVTGSYAGSGAASRDINLGFRPKAVVVFRQDFFQTTPPSHAVNAICVGNTTTGGLSTTSNGFQVRYDQGNSVYTNVSGFSYLYFAFR